MINSHKWNNGQCEICGITEDQYLAAYSWDELFCHGAKKVGDCCNRPSKVFVGNKWVCETCDTNDIFKKPPPAEFNRVTKGAEGFKNRECTCGAKFRGTPDRHYIWCDLEED